LLLLQLLQAKFIFHATNIINMLTGSGQQLFGLWARPVLAQPR
jgi:hypothetical protein